MTEVVWERVKDAEGGMKMSLWRAKILGGWLVAGSLGVTFVPDPKHEWK